MNCTGARRGQAASLERGRNLPPDFLHQESPGLRSNRLRRGSHLGSLARGAEGEVEPGGGNGTDGRGAGGKGGSPPAGGCNRGAGGVIGGSWGAEGGGGTGRRGTAGHHRAKRRIGRQGRAWVDGGERMFHVEQERSLEVASRFWLVRDRPLGDAMVLGKSD